MAKKKPKTDYRSYKVYTGYPQDRKKWIKWWVYGITTPKEVRRYCQHKGCMKYIKGKIIKLHSKHIERNMFVPENFTKVNDKLYEQDIFKWSCEEHKLIEAILR
jgi:hypothetical protein